MRRGVALPAVVAHHRIARQLGYRSWQHLEDTVSHLELLLMLDMLQVEYEAKESTGNPG